MVFYFAGEATIGLLRDYRGQEGTRVTLAEAIGIVLVAIATGLILFLGLIHVIARLFFPHLNIGDPFNLDSRKVEDERVGLRWAAIWGPLSREWFRQDESLEDIYAASDIPDFLPPSEESESSSHHGGTDDVTRRG